MMPRAFLRRREPPGNGPPNFICRGFCIVQTGPPAPLRPPHALAPTLPHIVGPIAGHEQSALECVGERCAVCVCVLCGE